MRKIFFIFTLIFISSCFGPGISDYEVQIIYKKNNSITESCSLFRSSAHAVEILCNLGEKNFKIDRKVYEYAYGDKYIVAKTNPVNILKYPNNPESSYKIPNESITLYWFLNLDEGIIEGPLSDSKENQLKYREIISENKLTLGFSR